MGVGFAGGWGWGLHAAITPGHVEAGARFNQMEEIGHQRVRGIGESVVDTEG